MKIAMLTDLEGVAGVTDFETQTYPTGQYYETAKLLLTEEVNASCEGALEAGATEILVIDGHGSGGIIPEKIHPRALLFHGRPVTKYWELDQGWDALFLLAHHAMNGVEDGNLNHTYSSKSIVNMWLNGQKIGETGMNVYLAGHFGIPTVLITGDEAGCREAAGYVPNIHRAVVKWGKSRTSAVSLAPETARAVIRKKSYEAAKGIGKFRPVKIRGKCELTTEYLSSAEASMVGMKPAVKKVNSTTVRHTGRNFIEMWDKWFYG